MNKTVLKPPADFIGSLQKLGRAGFLFFFFKGMLWLTIPWMAHTLVP